MAEDLARGRDEIETLLADRLRLQEWLARLDAAGEAPSAVRARVRGDYEGRLAEVVSRLRGYTSALTASLDELRTRVTALDGQRIEAEEERAEAELRHAVGEYGDDEWRRRDEQCGARLNGLLAELDARRGEIADLEEVLDQIHPSQPAAPARAPVEDAEGQGPELVREAPDAAARARSPEAPRFTPPGNEPRPRERPGRTLRFPAPTPGAAPAEPARSGDAVDEMTFLKSVALEGAEEESTARGPRGSTAGKTLKCTDCGAMNRPTEWYCERCGAELAAL